MTTLGHRPKLVSEKKKRGQAVRLYHSLEKQLLDQSQADKLTQVRRSFEPGNSIYHNAAAGWMLAESALIHTDLETEARLTLLEEARRDWQNALEIESSKLSNQEMHQLHLLSPNEIRINTALAASDVFSDIIKGDLKKETRQEYYEGLLYLGVKAAEGYEHYEDRVLIPNQNSGPDCQFVGIAHEMNAMLILARLKSPSLVCTPALMRADSGVNYPRKTHDLQVLNTKWGTIRDTLGVEVKTTARQEHFDRYDAVLIGGSLHLHPDRLRDPIFLAELLVKDYKEITTEKEQQTLNNITNNVVHSIRHGFRGTQQCREIETCQEITP